VVIGAAHKGPSSSSATHHERWSSKASSFSDYSDTSSQRTSSSTRTVGGGSDQAHLLRLRALILKAALIAGFQRPAHASGGASKSSSTTGSEGTSRSPLMSLQDFVQQLPPTAFGTMPGQMRMLGSYKRLVAADASLRDLAGVENRRFFVTEVARAVRWLGGGSRQWGWMRELFRLVVGFSIEEAGRRGGVLVT